jgi:hypothetical protein
LFTFKRVWVKERVRAYKDELDRRGCSRKREAEYQELLYNTVKGKGLVPDE